MRGTERAGISHGNFINSWAREIGAVLGVGIGVVIGILSCVFDSLTY